MNDEDKRHYCYWGALQLALWLVDLHESNDKSTEYMRKPKTVANVLKFLCKSKDRMMILLLTKKCCFRMMPVLNKKGKAIAYTPMIFTSNEWIDISDVKEMLSPDEYKFRDTAKILGEALRKSCETISLFTGRNTNDIFNSLLCGEEIEIPETFGKAPETLPKNEKKTKIIIDNNMNAEKYEKAKSVLRKTSEETKAFLRKQKTGCAVDVGFKVLKVDDGSENNDGARMDKEEERND